MVWGIIAALEEELALIVRAMEIERKQTVFGMPFYMGSIGHSRVAAAACGVGTINAAACAAALIREFGATALINTGVAGCLCEELRVLDVVLSSEVAFHDVDTRFLKESWHFRDRFPADSVLIQLAQQSIVGMNAGFRYKVGRIATGDAFVDDPALKGDIIDRLNPLCVEMEGAAVGQVAYMAGLPFLVIRSLSDDSGDGAQVSFEQFLARAAKNSAGIVLKMIDLAPAGR